MHPHSVPVLKVRHTIVPEGFARSIGTVLDTEELAKFRWMLCRIQMPASLPSMPAGWWSPEVRRRPCSAS